MTCSMARAALPVATKPMVGPTPQRSWARRCARASVLPASPRASTGIVGFDLLDAGIELGGKTLTHRPKAFGEQVTHGHSPSTHTEPKCGATVARRRLKSCGEIYGRQYSSAPQVVFGYVKTQICGIR